MHNPITQQHAHDLRFGNYPMENDSDPLITPYSEDMGWVVKMGPDSYTNDMPDAPYEDAKLLAHANHALETIIWLWKQNQQQQTVIDRLRETLRNNPYPQPGDLE